MSIAFSKAYKDARYELTVIDRDGKVMSGRCTPWRFNRILTAEEMRDGYENGFAKYAVPFFDTPPTTTPTT